MQVKNVNRKKTYEHEKEEEKKGKQPSKGGESSKGTVPDSVQKKGKINKSRTAPGIEYLQRSTRAENERGRQGKELAFVREWRSRGLTVILEPASFLARKSDRTRIFLTFLTRCGEEINWHRRGGEGAKWL